MVGILSAFWTYGLCKRKCVGTFKAFVLAVFNKLCGRALGIWKGYSGFFASKAIGILSGMFFITSSFYTYTGIIGTNFAVIDISLFAMGAIASYYVSYKYIKYSFKNTKLADLIGIAVLFIFAVMFCMFTFNPPGLGIFKP